MSRIVVKMFELTKRNVMLAAIKKPFQDSVLSWMIVWIVFMIIYTFSKSYGSIVSGGIMLFGNITLDILMFFYAFWLWKHSTLTAKLIFGLFALSFLFLLGTALFYHTLYDILQIPRAHVPLSVIFFYNTLFSGYLVCQLLAWIIALSAIKSPEKKSFSLYIPVAIVTIVTFFIYIFAASWHANLFSWLGFYDIIQPIFEVSSFIAAALCLTVSKNKGITYLALGYLIIMSAEFFLAFNLFSQKYGIVSLAETFWILGFLFTTYGFINIKKKFLTMSVTGLRL